MKNSIKVRNPKPLFDIISIAQTKDLIQQYNGVINEKTSTGSKKYYLLTNGNTIMLDKYEPAYLFTNKTNLKRFTQDRFKRIFDWEEPKHGFYIVDNNRLPCIVFFQKDFDKLMSLGKIEAFNNSLDNNDVFLIKNTNEIIRKEYNYYVLFNTVDDYVLSIENDNKNTRRTAHLLDGLNPYCDKFPDYVEYLINEKLCSLIAITSEQIKYERSYLFKLTELVYRDIIDFQRMLQLFIPLLAYVGKYICINYGAKWSMCYSEEFDIWEPNLEMPDGVIVNIIVKIFEIIDSNDDYTSTIGHAAILTKYKPLSR